MYIIDHEELKDEAQIIDPQVSYKYIFNNYIFSSIKK